ncbi:hypothetical protein BH11PSE4_BH11PSE4_04210 [soil metagenome]
MKTKNFHFFSGVIQRSRGQSVYGSAAYGGCTKFNSGARRGDYSSHARHHVGTVMALPPEAPAEYADEGIFLIAVAAAETRADAQEGRVLVFSIPRAVPRHLWVTVAAFTIAPFIALGFAARIDIEAPDASDGLPHPHAHTILSQRPLGPAGFGKKDRSANLLFRKDGGRYVRAMIAGRLTLACAMLAIPVTLDHRRNDERGIANAEIRIRKVNWHCLAQSTTTQSVEDIGNHRRAMNEELDASNDNLGSFGLQLQSAVSSANKPNEEEQLILLNSVNSVLAIQCIEAVQVDGSLQFMVDGVGIQCWVDRICTEQTISPAGATAVTLCVRALDWPAVVATGDDESFDRLVTAGVQAGIAVINRPASATALSAIKGSFGRRLHDEVFVYDRNRVAGGHFRLHQTEHFVKAMAYAPSLIANPISIKLAAHDRQEMIRRFVNAMAYGAQISRAEVVSATISGTHRGQQNAATFEVAVQRGTLLPTGPILEGKENAEVSALNVLEDMELEIFPRPEEPVTRQIGPSINWEEYRLPDWEKLRVAKEDNSIANHELDPEVPKR